ncbi:hypothetical protein GWI33_003564, partial [Rhynchophorus ferrugineus]
GAEAHPRESLDKENLGQVARIGRRCAHFVTHDLRWRSSVSAEDATGGRIPSRHAATPTFERRCGGRFGGTWFRKTLDQGYRRCGMR